MIANKAMFEITIYRSQNAEHDTTNALILHFCRKCKPPCFANPRHSFVSSVSITRLFSENVIGSKSEKKMKATSAFSYIWSKIRRQNQLYENVSNAVIRKLRNVSLKLEYIKGSIYENKNRTQ